MSSSTRSAAPSAARAWTCSPPPAGYLPAHPEAVAPTAEAALEAAAAGLLDIDVETLPLAEAATAHRRLEEHSVDGRIVLAV